jgi:hypothetical protein
VYSSSASRVSSRNRDLFEDFVEKEKTMTSCT